MKNLRWILLLMLLVPMALQAQLRATDLKDPAPISVPEGVSQSQVRQAISDALYRRDWTIHSENEAAGEIVADLHVRSHWAQIGIDYSGGQVRIAYRDSDNLHYDQRDGREIIHRNYLNWIDHLVQDIRRQLSYAARR